MPEDEIIAAQLRHAIDLLRAEVKLLHAQVEHQRQLNDARLGALEQSQQDHESRIRQVQESATQFKLIASLATGGGLLSLVALIRTLAG
jgi:hypothetical protein